MADKSLDDITLEERQELFADIVRPLQGYSIKDTLKALLQISNAIVDGAIE